MINLKKALNYRIIIVSISILFIFNAALYSYQDISKGSLRIPVGQRETRRRMNTAMASNAGMIRLKFMETIGMGGIAPAMSSPAIAQNIRPVSEQNEISAEDIENFIIGLRYIPENRYTKDILSQLNRALKEFNSVRRAINKVENLKTTSPTKYAQEMEKLLQKFLEYLYKKDYMPGILNKPLVAGLISEGDIFEELEESNIDPGQKEKLEKDLLLGIVRAQMEYVFLKCAGFDVKEGFGQTRAFNLISLGGTSYLFRVYIVRPYWTHLPNPSLRF